MLFLPHDITISYSVVLNIISGACMFGISLLWGCFDSLPQQIQDPSDIPRSISESACPVGTRFVNENDSFFCIDTVSEKKHGPSLEILTTGRVFRSYSQGEEIQIPWFLNSEEKEDEEQTKQYLQQELSLVLLKDAEKRFPQNKDIQARLSEKGAIHPDTLFSNQPFPCEKEPQGMKCITGGGWVQHIYGADDVHYRAFWNNRFFADTDLVQALDVQQCQADCKCPAGTWNSWSVAQAYCAQQGKRLPTENELWMMYGKQKNEIAIPPQRGLEWTADDFVANATQETVLWNPQGECWKDCKGKTAISINQHRQSHSTTASFRCVVSDLVLLTTQNIPTRLSQLPELNAITQKWRASWVHNNPNSMASTVEAKAPFLYLTGNQIAETLWAYHQEHLELSSVYQIGRSHENTPLLAIKIGANSASATPKPSILIEGGHHGNELLSILYVLHNLDALLNDTPRKVLEQYDFWFVPLVNPDGLQSKLFGDSSRQFGRKNGRNTDGSCLHSPAEGVDLNRNYPFQWNASKDRGSKSDPESAYYRGEQPASEPETQALMSLAKQEHFVASLSFHTPGSSILVPYMASNTQHPQPYVAWDIAEQLAKQVALKSGIEFSVRNRRFYAEGTFQDWQMHQFGTIAFLIEGTEHNPETIPKIRESINEVSSFLPLLIKALDARPHLEGIVVNEQGEALYASIQVRGYDMLEGETWKSRASDGYFYRSLLDDGTYEIIAHAPGYETLHQECTVSKEAKPCRLVLKQVF